MLEYVFDLQCLAHCRLPLNNEYRHCTLTWNRVSMFKCICRETCAHAKWEIVQVELLPMLWTLTSKWISVLSDIWGAGSFCLGIIIGSVLWFAMVQKCGAAFNGLIIVWLFRFDSSTSNTHDLFRVGISHHSDGSSSRIWYWHTASLEF